MVGETLRRPPSPLTRRNISAIQSDRPVKNSEQRSEDVTPKQHRRACSLLSVRAVHGSGRVNSAA